MARVFGVFTRGCYAWFKRVPSARAEAGASVAERVRSIHEASRGTYGAPRVQA